MAGMHSPRIVIVDDDVDVRSVVVFVVREILPSARVSEHVSARLALAQINEDLADLLITNCHMPDMDGPTLVKALRKAHNPIPIIMVSGSDDARRRGEAAGIDRF